MTSPLAHAAPASAYTTAVRPVPAWLAALAGAAVARAEVWCTRDAVRVGLVTPDGRASVLELREHGGSVVSTRGAAPAEAATLYARARWVGARLLGLPLAAAYRPSPREERAAALCSALIGTRADIARVADPVSPDVARFVDVVAGRWERVFAAAPPDDEAWIAPVVHGVAGDAAAMRACAAAPAPRGTLAVIAGAAFKLARFDAAAREAFEQGAVAVADAVRAAICVELADLCHDAGDDARAVAWARRAALCVGDDDELLAHAAARLVRAGAFDDARLALEERCAREPRRRTPLLALARLYAWAGHAADARAALERAPTLGPDDADALRVRGAVLALERRWDEARAAFERALALAPGDAEALTWLAEVHLRRGDRPGAARCLGASRTVIQTAAHTLLTAALEARDPEVHPELGAVLDYLGEARAAWAGEPARREAAALALLDRFGGNRTEHLTRVAGGGVVEPVRLPARDAGQASRDASAALLRRVGTVGEDELAARFEALAAEYPASPHPYCYAGELALWRGEYDRALELFDRALARAPARWAYVGRGAVFMLRGAYDASDAAFAECARRFEPVTGATTHVYLGESLRRRGRYDAAREHLAEAVRAKPGRVGAWMNLALAHLARGADADARPIFADLAARVPRLYWDARPDAAVWPVPFAHAPALFERALEMMRGNRSSHTVTYVDARGALRLAPDATAWRTMLAAKAPLVAREVRSRIVSGALADP